MSVDFTPLLSLLHTDSPGEQGEGLTAKEIAQQIGKGIEKTRTIIRTAQELGLVRPGKRTIVRINGVPAKIDTYVLEVRQ